AAPDALSHLSILWNDGKGVFRETTPVSLPAPVMSIAPADFDHDNRLDLAVASGHGYVGVIMSLGNRAYAPRVQLEAGQNPNWAEARDYDGDGWADLAVINSGSVDLTVFLNDGKGNLGAGRTVPLSTWWKPRFLKGL